MINKNFMPASVWVKNFLKNADSHFAIALERENGIVERYETKIKSNDIKNSKIYIERTIKSLLWICGGYRLYISGNNEICEYIKTEYSVIGTRKFDVLFMSKIYDHDFEVIICKNIPNSNISKLNLKIDKTGNRIGLDMGGSFIKVCAVSDNDILYHNRIAWDPIFNSDIAYHENKIKEAINQAKKHINADRICISSAGVQIENKTKTASLFRNVTDSDSISNFYLNATKGYDTIVINDGDTAALYGMLSGDYDNVLGISIGTSEAGGYIDNKGTITGRLNELAFVPIDFSNNALVDGWSGDKGCGVNYLSQSGVIDLAPLSGITLNNNSSLSERCFEIQKLVKRNIQPAIDIYKTLGEYLGYALAYYSLFYNYKNVFLTGGVVSKNERNIVINSAKYIIENEFPELDINFIDTPLDNNSYINQAYAVTCLKNV